ncbi:MAG: LptF/LptG family permease [Prevotellaceae bacterium]|jgi:lipopolysaccharide export system permease protein|nr:LptF/LptG family permease [Prevotellaceae bacterium]
MEKPMKILDRYIIKKFLSTYVFAILAITLIIIIFDTSQRIDNFVSKQVPLSAIIFDFYGNFIPYLVNIFSALFTFIAVIFFTSKMASHTEIVAMLSNGVSMGRIMRPYLMVATFIALANCYLANVVIPPASVRRYNFEEKYLKNPYQNRDRHIHRQTQQGYFAYIESFNVRNQTAYSFSLEHIDDDGLTAKLTSNEAVWDTATNAWHVSQYVIRTITDSGEVIRTGASLDTTINLTGKDLSVRVNKLVETMGYREINDYINMLKLQGASNVDEMLIEKHKRFAYPMASIILTIIGVALSSRKMRGGMGLHIGLGVGLSFSYILFQRFSEMFVQGGWLTPAIALWIPNVLFLFIAIWLYRTAPQ